MLKKTRLGLAAVSAALALAIVPAIGALAPAAQGQGCDGECPPPQGCGVQPVAVPAPSPNGASGDFNPQGGNGGSGGDNGCLQGKGQGSNQGQGAGSASGPTITGGGEGSSTASSSVSPAIPGGGSVIFSRSNVNMSQHTKTSAQQRNGNRTGNSNGGRGGNASNHF
jgi:hypothetical protein